MTATPQPKALILGIDGGSLALIEPMIEAGELPVLARLLSESAFGSTTTTWPAHTAPGWSTFVTGRQPGGHGVYQFFGTQEPDYGDRLLGTADFGCTTMWEWLAEQGLSVGLINVPMSHPPREVPGYQVTWPLSQTLRYSSPPGLLGELARAGAGFRPDIAAMFTGDLGYVDGALDHVRARTRSARHLMTTRPVDVVMFVITEPDRVCHHYWHFSDPCHPAHETPPAEDMLWAEAIRATYMAVDSAFGEILELVGDETPVMLVSDHGFGQGRHNLSLNAVLAQAGLLATGPTPPGSASASWFRHDDQAVDFSRTRAYMPTPGCYAVNLNRVGRQREGVVTAAEASGLLDEVASLMLSLRTPDTGDAVFAAALPRADAYPGTMSASAPDLLLIPADEATLASPDFTGPVWRPSDQTGMHRHAGLWSLRAPGVRPGRVAAPAALADLAPTLLHQLGLRFPAGIDGRPLPTVLGSGSGRLEFLDEHSAPPVSTVDSERHLRDDDLTTRTLSAMGYL